jgi:hypothetical protein
LWLVAALLIIALSGVCLLEWKARPRSDQNSIPAGAETQPSVPNLEVSAVATRGTISSDVVSDPTGKPRILRGVVLAEGMFIPVAAQISLGTAETRFSNPTTGTFQLELWDEPGDELVVSAAGYDSARVNWRSTGTNDLRILLTPRDVSAVLVEYEDGQPAVDVTVSWQAAIKEPERSQLSDWMRAGARVDGTVLTSRTDLNGRAEQRLGVVGLAAVTEHSNSTPIAVRVLPGEVVRVRLLRNSRTVRFVDLETRQPRPGLEIETWSPTAPGCMSVMSTTDHAGEVRIALDSTPILIRRAGAAMWQSELFPLSSGMTRAGLGGPLETVIRIASAPMEQPLIVGISACGPGFLLIDQATRNPIESLARLKKIDPTLCGTKRENPGPCTSQSPRAVVESLDQTYRVIHGELEMPCQLRSLLSGKGAQAFVLAVAGYVPIRVDRTMLAESGPTTLRLTSCPSKTLIVKSIRGEPYRQAVLVFDAETDCVVWQSNGTQDGVHGPIDWFGKDFLVRAGAGKGWTFRIGAAECDSASILERTVPGELGSIEIRNVPKDYPINQLIVRFGRSVLGTDYSPMRAASRSVYFEALPCGSYLVGPRRWVDATELQLISQDSQGTLYDTEGRVEVEPNSTSVVEWKQTWSAGVPLTGSVRFEGSRQPAFVLVPCYVEFPRDPSATSTPLVPRAVFGRRAPTIQKDTTGKYLIEPTAPLPAVLAVCLLLDGEWGTTQALQVVETLAPGDSILIPTCELSIDASGSPPLPDQTVRFQVQETVLRLPLSTAHSWRTIAWKAGETLHVEDVPTSVVQLSIGAQAFAVRLRAGELNRFTLQDGKLSASTR